MQSVLKEEVVVQVKLKILRSVLKEEVVVQVQLFILQSVLKVQVKLTIATGIEIRTEFLQSVLKG